jgi:hypothetical protein
MRIRFAVCLVLLGIFLPAPAFAAQGILLLADDGKPEWKTQLLQLVASVDKQKPTEVAFWTETNPNVQAAVERLVRRGISEIVAVPLFTTAPLADVSSSVKSSVPLRLTAPLNANLVAEIVLGRAQEISANPAAEVLVLVSHRSMADAKRWLPDLAAVARQLNMTRRFATILTIALPPDGSQASGESAQMRSILERQIAAGRRILVIPFVTPYGATESALNDQLQGIAHEVAKNALMPDDRLVRWIVSQAEGK